MQKIILELIGILTIAYKMVTKNKLKLIWKVTRKERNRYKQKESLYLYVNKLLNRKEITKCNPFNNEQNITGSVILY